MIHEYQEALHKLTGYVVAALLATLVGCLLAGVLYSMTRNKWLALGGFFAGMGLSLDVLFRGKHR